MTKLIIADRRGKLSSEELCGVDFAPLWASQDPGASMLKVTAANKADSVAVEFTYPSSGEQIRIRYRMIKTTAGESRIDDIEYTDAGPISELLGVGCEP